MHHLTLLLVPGLCLLMFLATIIRQRDIERSTTMSATGITVWAVRTRPTALKRSIPTQLALSTRLWGRMPLLTIQSASGIQPLEILRSQATRLAITTRRWETERWKAEASILPGAITQQTVLRR